MAYLKTVTHAILFILGIWALGQVFYRRAPVDIRAEQSHAVEADKNARAHTAEIGLCFIVRTYWAHGANEGSSPLTAMLQSFIQSNHKKWEALILVMDKKVRTTLILVMDKKVRTTLILVMEKKVRTTLILVMDKKVRTTKYVPNSSTIVIEFMYL